MPSVSSLVPSAVLCSRAPPLGAAPSLRLRHTLLGGLLGGALLLAALPALAQPREVESGDFVLRSSTVSSTSISAETAREHGIQQGPDRAVLNVVLLQRGVADRTVPAEVRASRRNMAGVEQNIDMRPVRTGDWVSYMGTYEFLPGEVVIVRIEATPMLAMRAPLVLQYRDRMPNYSR